MVQTHHAAGGEESEHGFVSLDARVRSGAGNAEPRSSGPAGHPGDGSRRFRSRIVSAAAGIVLGSLAPVGSLVLRVVLQGAGLEDLREHSFFYLYELIGSAVVFGAFGFALGARMDRIRGRRDWYRDKADHDDLTGFLSHTAFRREVARSAEACCEAREPFAVLLIAAGPLPGSETDRGSHSTKAVLLHVAAAVRHVCRAEHAVGRWGGLELAVLLPGSDPFAAEDLARDLKARVLDRPVFDAGNRTFWQLTIGGVAGVPTLPADRLLLRAQDALGEAHRSKEGTVILST